MASAVSRHGLCKKQECFLSCLVVEGFRCVRGRRGRTGDAKATSDSKYQLGIIYAHQGTRTNGFYRDLGDSSD